MNAGKDNKTMLTLAIPLLLFIVCFTDRLIAASTYDPKPYKVTLDLKRQGMHAGQMTLSLSIINSSMLTKSVFRPSKLAKLFGIDKATEETKFILLEDQLLPYKHSSSQKGQQIDILFDYTTSSYHDKNGRLGDIPSTAQTTLSVLSALLKDIQSKQQSVSYAVLSKNQFKNYDITLQYDQLVSVDKKQINTTKITMHKGSKTSIFWLAEEYNWAPIMLENYKRGKMILKGIFNKIEL